MSVNRRIHLVGGVVGAVIVIVIAVTGILLNHKREFGYMVEPYIPFEYGKISPMSLDEIARAAVTGTPELSATSANDVRWIDFRPGLSYAKVRFRDGRDTEVLIDAYDGDVVSVASRQDAFLERHCASRRSVDVGHFLAMQPP